MDVLTKLGDPVDFESYQGQEAIKRRFTLRMNAMTRGDSFKTLLYAPAGHGKTSLVRVVANELIKRKLADHYIESIAGKFETKFDLDVFIRKLEPYTIVFIDEIHGLGGVVRDALYPAIQDGIYAFNDETRALVLPPGISWIGATTDLGKVHPALQRRLLPVALEPLNEEDRMWMALLQPREVKPDAAKLIANRCWSPWEVKDELYATAADVATEKQEQIISLDHVLEACGLLGIDRNGLRPKERAVLDALHSSTKILRGKRMYALAKNQICVIAGIDDATYSNAIEPKLLKLGMVSVSAGVGRSLTEKAIEEYYQK